MKQTESLYLGLSIRTLVIAIGRMFTSDKCSRFNDQASEVRKEFYKYFDNEDSVPWQDRMLHAV